MGEGTEGWKEAGKAGRGQLLGCHSSLTDPELMLLEGK